MGPNSTPWGQVITSGGHNIPLYFDGWKCYLSLHKPTASDVSKYKVIELTSALPYKLQRRSSRLMPTVRRASVEDWRKRLSYPTFEVTKATLKNTTQHIKTLQAETWEYMRDHYKTRAWALRPCRINDVCYSDTFFSTICSVRGYKCFQLFAFKRSKFDVVKLMRREAMAP